MTPFIDTLYNEYSHLVHFSGVAFDSDLKAVKDYNAKHRAGWKNFHQTKENNAIINKLKVSSYPTFFLIDHNGTILIRAIGKRGIQEIYDF